MRRSPRLLASLSTLVLTASFLVAVPGLVSAPVVSAAPAEIGTAALPSGLTATKIGWNVIGLDSNKVTVGPNQFPNGVQICNTTGALATGVADWVWAGGTDANIKLDSPVQIPWSLENGSCRSIYWVVEVTRDRSSYFKTRDFSITVTPTSGTATTVTAPNQQIFVEKLVSQNRNVVGTLTGPGIAPNSDPVYVGQEYTYTVTGATAPGGYEQLEFAAVFDPAFFEILEVTQNYAANSAPLSRVPNPNFQLYADGCQWVNDSASPNYMSCLSTGKVGGNMTSTYRVKIIGSGSSQLNTLIYDFSGSSFHYNADFGAGPTITTRKQSLSVVKTASASTYSSNGQSITFTFTITNTGDDTVSNITIDDTTSRPGFADTSLPVPACDSALSGLVLNSDDSIVCTQSYSTTSNDVSAASFINSVTVIGEANGQQVSAADSVTLLYSSGSSVISASKSASPLIFTSADETITYTFSVGSTNSSPADVTIIDPQIDVWGANNSGQTSGCNLDTSVSGINSTPYLCTAYHTITSADRARGYIDNTAFITVDQSGGGTKTAQVSARVTYAGLNSSLSLTKAATPATFSQVGDLITYTFGVTNTGDDTLTNISVSDPILDAPAVCDDSVLSPAGSTSCTGIKTMTQADVDVSQIVNIARATGITTNGTLKDDTATATVTSPAAAPSMSLTKTTTSPSYGGEGDVLHYGFTVVNTGNVTLNNIAINDPKLDAPGATCQATTLAPDDTTFCVGLLTVSAAQMADDSIVNTATATAIPARGTLTPPTSTVTVPKSVSKIVVTKVARDDTVSGVGANASFDITVINSGNTTLTNITVDDTIFRDSGGDTPVPVTCSTNIPATLAPSSSFTCTVNYTFSQADVDAGVLNNTVFAQGFDGVTTVDDSSVAQVLGPAPSPRLSLEKVAVTDSFFAVDDTVNYVFTLRNTGNVTLTNVSVNDPALAQPAICITTTLAPGQSTTCEGYYLVTNSDLSLQWLANTATAGGTAPNGLRTTSAPSTAYVPKLPPPPLTVTKTVSDDTFAQVGDNVTYTITVSNISSDDTITDLTLDDPLFPGSDPFGGLTCAGRPGTNADDTVLNPGSSFTCTGVYTITLADMNSGFVNNTVTAVGINQANRPVFDRDAVTITGPANVTTGITVTKSTTTTSYSAQGQVVPFDFLVKNTGTVTLTSVTVLDGSLTSGPSCPQSTLNPDDTMICTGTYTITSADLSQNEIVNVASATGVPTRGDQPTSNRSTVIVPSALLVPSLAVTKTASPTTYRGSGESINFTVSVVNDGDDTITNITVDDTLTSATAADDSVTLTCTPTAPFTLNPGDSATCTGSTVTTSTQVTDDSFINTATATGTPATAGGSITETGSTTVTYIPPVPAMTVTKSATPTTFSAAGSTINFSVTVTNTGDDTLTNVTVDDTITTSGAPDDTISLTCTPSAPFTLNPGDFAVCTGNSTTTAGQVSAGSFVNTAVATATPASGGSLTQQGTATVTYIAPTPPGPTPGPTSGLTVTKSGSPSSVSTAGDVITYTVTAQNSGTTTLTGVTVSDPKVDLTCTPALPVASLAPGSTITCTGNYTVTAGDVAAGAIENVASATGTPPTGGPVTATGRTSTPVESKPALRVTKSASPQAFSRAGDRIRFTVVVSNTGNISLNAVSVTDPLVSLVCSPVLPRTLQPGGSSTCTGTYTVTQADVDAGTITNTATATGTPPGGQPITATDSVTIVDPIEPALAVAKTASPTTFTAVGDVITFTIVSTNIGNATLRDVRVTDPSVSLTCSPATPVRRLAPGAEITCSGSYRVTQADVDSGSIANTATAAGTDPQGKQIRESGSAQVPGPVAAASIRIAKSSMPSTVSSVGESVTYTIVATNNGNVTLRDVRVSDPTVSLRCSPSSPAAALAPGERITCTGTKTVTQAEFDAGSVTNAARVRGTTPTGSIVSDDVSVTTPATAGDPKLTITTTASPKVVTQVGQRVKITNVVTNVGKVTVDDVVVTTSLPLTNVSCDRTSVKPGQTLTCVGYAKTTRSDFTRGLIVDTGEAIGTPSRGVLLPVEDNDDVRTERAWLRAQPSVTPGPGAASTVTIERIRWSSNLTPPTVRVICRPTGVAVRGDFDYCTWARIGDRIVVTTTRPDVRVRVVLTSSLRDDRSVKVRWKKSINT